LLADSRLRDAIDLGGLGKAFCLRKVAKYFETFNLHLMIRYANNARESTALPFRQLGPA